MNRAAYEAARGERPSWRIAAEVGIPAPYLSKIVNGKVNPGVHIARRIADTLGVSLDLLWPRGGGILPTGTDPERRVVSIREAGAKGGHARAARLTAAERSEAARKAVEARWIAVRAAREVSARSRWDLGARRHVRAANSCDAATYPARVA